MPVTPNKAVSSQALKAKSAVCTAAKTTYGDATNAVHLMDAGANGSDLYSLSAMPRATVTVTQLQLYRSPDNGTTMYFIDSTLGWSGGYTLAQTTAAPQVPFPKYGETSPLRLEIGDSLWVAIGVACSGGVVFDATAEDL